MTKFLSIISIYLIMQSSYCFAEESSIFDFMFNNQEQENKQPENKIDATPKNGINNQLNLSGDFYKTANIKILNKKSGKSENISVSINSPYIYNNELTIRLLRCWKENVKRFGQEDMAFIELYSIIENSEITLFDKNWIYSEHASKIAHPKYEILLISCA